MQREPISVSIRKILNLDIKKNIQSWESVIRNDWIIKFSVYKGSILLTFISTCTGQTIIRYFKDEDVACSFINMIIDRDPRDLISFQ